MTVQSGTMETIVPVWAQQSFLRAIWVEAGDTAESIAARTDALLSKIGEVLKIDRWELPDGTTWEGDSPTLTEIVRHNAVRDEPRPDFPQGELLIEYGYSFVLQGSGTAIKSTVWVNAGHIAIGRKMPTHRLKVDLDEKVPGVVTSSIGDGVCAAIAETWKPANIMLTETIANRVARRSNWKILVGYRTWINATVGAVTQVAEGLTLTKLAGGALVSAPDDWPAERVVEAMTATLRANGLDEVPH